MYIVHCTYAYISFHHELKKVSAILINLLNHFFFYFSSRINEDKGNTQATYQCSPPPSSYVNVWAAVVHLKPCPALQITVN